MTKTNSQLAAEMLAPMIKFRQAARGNGMLLLNAYNQGLAEPVRRTTFERWLNEDPAKRIEPMFGAGLRLMATWRQIQWQQFQDKHVLAFTTSGKHGVKGTCACGAYWLAVRDTTVNRADIRALHLKHMTEIFYGKGNS